MTVYQYRLHIWRRGLTSRLLYPRLGCRLIRTGQHPFGAVRWQSGGPFRILLTCVIHVYLLLLQRREARAGCGHVENSHDETYLTGFELYGLIGARLMLEWPRGVHTTGVGLPPAERGTELNGGAVSNRLASVSNCVSMPFSLRIAHEIE